MSVAYRVELADKSRDFSLDMAGFIGDLGYGVYRNDVLVEEYPGEGDDLVVYDRKRIGRGISVSLLENGFEFNMLMPDTREETGLFFELIERMAKQMGDCVITDDGENIITLSDIPECRKKIEEGNIKALKYFENARSRDNNLMLYCARYVLFLNKEMQDRLFGAKDIMETFGDILHEYQNVDADMITSGFYATPYGITGIYIIHRGKRSIVPVKPSVPFGVTGKDNKPLEVKRWFAVYYSDEEKSVMGAAEYDSFLKAVGDISKPFDGACLLVEEISPETAGEIFNKGRRDIFGE